MNKNHNVYFRLKESGKGQKSAAEYLNMRTPVTVIIGYFKTLEENPGLKWFCEVTGL